MSITILNDGETFMPTSGTIVLDYNEDKLSQDARDDLDNGYPQQAFNEVIEDDKQETGRVLNVSTLVELYDLMRELDPETKLPAKVWLKLRQVENLD